jgi:hypothetical protein
LSVSFTASAIFLNTSFFSGYFGTIFLNSELETYFLRSIGFIKAAINPSPFIEKYLKSFANCKPPSKSFLINSLAFLKLPGSISLLDASNVFLVFLSIKAIVDLF